MGTVVKILILSFLLSGAIKYGLPLILRLDQLSLLDRDRLALLLLTGIPGLFLFYLWRR
ncbi:MAG: hypothetical protein RMK91_03145 [Pseudanabaenaceae cyanobacterium SKYGB_i_bin29]|nr:hypothetical protein [Pseudanabaenaceae cyanobacterium SKYG29]MDW8420839.1 hypothetical protein [Pseudanabaenaceae cyanobacterium SKYGB_i_bin29]